jgi:hypothetical protein
MELPLSGKRTSDNIGEPCRHCEMSSALEFMHGSYRERPGRSAVHFDTAVFGRNFATTERRHQSGSPQRDEMPIDDRTDSATLLDGTA